MKDIRDNKVSKSVRAPRIRKAQKTNPLPLDESENNEKKIMRRYLQFAGVGALVTLVLVLILSVFGGVDFSLGRLGGSTNSASNITSGATEISPEQSGKVALTESQLRAEVKKISVPVYWAGPQDGALYTLENQANLRVFVRYLPDGKIPPDGEASKRIIGTYILKDAFQSTKLAGTTVAGGTGFVNDDGAAVYYNSSLPSNVYVAYQGVDAQVEVFDPNEGVALRLATAKGIIQVIK